MANIKKDVKMNKKGMGARPFVIGFIAMLVFYLAITGFSINLLSERNPDSEILSSDYEFNQSYNTMKSSAEGLSTLSDGWARALSGATVNPLGFLYLISEVAFTIPKNIFISVWALLSSFWTVVMGSFTETSGLPSLVVLGSKLIFVGLLITFILLIIKLIRTGESERYDDLRIYKRNRDG